MSARIRLSEVTFDVEVDMPKRQVATGAPFLSPGRERKFLSTTPKIVSLKDRDKRAFDIWLDGERWVVIADRDSHCETWVSATHVIQMERDPEPPPKKTA